MKKEDPNQFPTIPSLVGKDVYLRVMEAEENEQTYLWFLHSDPQSQSCHEPKMVTPRDVVESCKKREKTVKDADFLIVLKEDNQPVGKIRYFNLNMMNRSAELGYIISPDHRKKGYAKQGILLLIRYLFTYLGLNKIYAQTAAFNEASVKLLESLDFKRDAVLRQHHFYRGNFSDDYIYSLLKFECGYLNEQIGPSGTT